MSVKVQRILSWKLIATGCVTKPYATLRVRGSTCYFVLLLHITKHLLLFFQNIRFGSYRRRARYIALNTHESLKLGRHLPVLIVRESRPHPCVGGRSRSRRAVTVVRLRLQRDRRDSRTSLRVGYND